MLKNEIEGQSRAPKEQLVKIKIKNPELSHQ
jgi:hypothetical protein